MLKLPCRGFSISVAKHNVSCEVACDWLEGSLLFSGSSEISKSDVVDIMLEEQIYQGQDFAYEMATNIWNELIKRHQAIGRQSPFIFKQKHISFASSWENFIGLSFPVYLSLRSLYPSWSNKFTGSYSEQGALFERFTKDAFISLFPGWKSELIGWSPNSPRNISEVATSVAGHLGESTGNIEKWTSKDLKDAGLDLLCFRPFNDSKASFPSFLLQCASGDNWDEKLHTPDLKVWRKLVDFSVEPKKGFAFPFCLSDQDYRRRSVIVDGLFLDRYRLLPNADEPDSWISCELKRDITDWISRNVDDIPTF